MIVVAIIAAILTAFFLFRGLTDYSDGWLSAAGLFAIITVIAFLASLNFRISSQQLTGFIYSSEDRAGYTTGHLRFSENAGTDEQPSFCAPSSSKAGEQIREYAGSGKKVKISIPPYFYFSNNPFACGTDKMVITEIK